MSGAHAAADTPRPAVTDSSGGPDVQRARETDDRTSRRSLATRLLVRPEIGSIIGALVICGFFLAVAPPFRNVANVGTILYAASTIGIMAVPVALLMIGGEFDLSAGVAVTTAGLTTALLGWYLNLHVWFAVLLSLVVMIGIGVLNGMLLVRTRLPSFLVTLATFFGLQGVNLGVTRLVTGNVASNQIADMAGYDSAHAVFASEWQVGSVTLKVTVLYWLLLTAVGAWVLLRTRQGNWVLAVGGDEAAARASGVPVRRTKIALYVFVAVSAWLLGMHLLFGYGVVQSGEGVGNEFVYIIAAVVGGCLLTGGFGSVLGSAVGALIYGMTSLGINYAGWNADWFKTFLGVMLLLATLVNLWLKQKAERRS